MRPCIGESLATRFTSTQHFSRRSHPSLLAVILRRAGAGNRKNDSTVLATAKTGIRRNLILTKIMISAMIWAEGEIMWYICNSTGSAHAVCDDGCRIAVRRFPDPRNSPDWIVLVDGIRFKELGTHQTRDSAMKQAELWIQLRKMEA